MPILTPEQKQQIKEALDKRGVHLPCPRCGKGEFVILDGYFIQPISAEKNSLRLGGPAIPSAVLACVNCGWMSQHALGLIGLLPKDNPQSSDPSSPQNGGNNA